MVTPLIAIPAITDEDVSVRTPTNLVFVELNPDSLLAYLADVKRMASGLSEENFALSSVACSSYDHEFVQTFEPEGPKAEDMDPSLVELGYRLDELATSETSGLRVDAEMVTQLRAHGFIKLCDTQDESIQFSIENEMLQFRGKYCCKAGYHCSSRPIFLYDFIDLCAGN